MGKKIEGIDPDAKKRLFDYNWPGNIRELENVIERAVNLTTEPIITVNELPHNIADYAGLARESDAVQRSDDADILSNSAKIIKDALAAEHGNVSRTAERLGISKRTLYRRISLYDINVNEFRLL